ncbi:hypothetical protein AV540_20645 [Brevibacillus parabrevis]|uniref:hypothetical protein n=1 Tax=Brevibacillus parabrevis TaxID=54914 RepID=UPI0007AB25E3|nr:hypothetical protein [Brevibacillus parabrevis]KZE46997.1 hypothetical protein AV540_20645 [Brevibacillus parabrevis]
MSDYKLFTSCLWQTTSAVVSTTDRLYLFDPAYFPHEIEAIAEYVQNVRNGLAESFRQISYDDAPINQYLQDSHEQNRIVLMKEAVSLTG